jgi:hypothetical protein
MAEYEYKVVSAPRKARSFEGVRSHEDQFAHVLMDVMNKMAKNDWEYWRAESLPCEEKSGLTARVVSYQSVLIFRRKLLANDKFFETPPKQRIEDHSSSPQKTPEVQSTQPRPISPGAHDTMSDMPMADAGQGILSMLQERKKRRGPDVVHGYQDQNSLAAE